MEPLHLRRFGILLSLLILEASSSSVDASNGTIRYPTCNYNNTMPKLEGIIKSSVRDVLSEFFTEPNSETDANRNQTESNHATNLYAGCPLGWFRILDSCLWVAPKDMKLNHDDAYMFCKRKILGGKLFEPLSKVHNDHGRDLVDAFDGKTYSGYIWIGINDHMEEGRYVYTKSDEPILFENWVNGQPDDTEAAHGQNCIVYESSTTAATTKLWRDLTCTNKYRFICEKYLA